MSRELFIEIKKDIPIKKDKKIINYYEASDVHGNHYYIPKNMIKNYSTSTTNKYYYDISFNIEKETHLLLYNTYNTLAKLKIIVKSNNLDSMNENRSIITNDIYNNKQVLTNIDEVVGTNIGETGTNYPSTNKLLLQEKGAMKDYQLNPYDDYANIMLWYSAIYGSTYYSMSKEVTIPLLKQYEAPLRRPLYYDFGSAISKDNIDKTNDSIKNTRNLSGVSGSIRSNIQHLIEDPSYSGNYIPNFNTTPYNEYYILHRINNSYGIDISDISITGISAELVYKINEDQQVELGKFNISDLSFTDVSVNNFNSGSTIYVNQGFHSITNNNFYISKNRLDTDPILDISYINIDLKYNSKLIKNEHLKFKITKISDVSAGNLKYSQTFKTFNFQPPAPIEKNGKDLYKIPEANINDVNFYNETFQFDYTLGEFLPYGGEQYLSHDLINKISFEPSFNYKDDVEYYTFDMSYSAHDTTLDTALNSNFQEYNVKVYVLNNDDYLSNSPIIQSIDISSNNNFGKKDISFDSLIGIPPTEVNINIDISYNFDSSFAKLVLSLSGGENYEITESNKNNLSFISNNIPTLKYEPSWNVIDAATIGKYTTDIIEYSIDFTLGNLNYNSNNNKIIITLDDESKIYPRAFNSTVTSSITTDNQKTSYDISFVTIDLSYDNSITSDLADVSFIIPFSSINNLLNNDGNLYKLNKAQLDGITYELPRHSNDGNKILFRRNLDSENSGTYVNDFSFTIIDNEGLSSSGNVTINTIYNIVVPFTSFTYETPRTYTYNKYLPKGKNLLLSNLTTIDNNLGLYTYYKISLNNQHANGNKFIDIYETDNPNNKMIDNNLIIINIPSNNDSSGITIEPNWSMIQEPQIVGPYQFNIKIFEANDEPTTFVNNWPNDADTNRYYRDVSFNIKLQRDLVFNIPIDNHISQNENIFDSSLYYLSSITLTNENNFSDKIFQELYNDNIINIHDFSFEINHISSQTQDGSNGKLDISYTSTQSDKTIKFIYDVSVNIDNIEDNTKLDQFKIKYTGVTYENIFYPYSTGNIRDINIIVNSSPDNIEEERVIEYIHTVPYMTGTIDLSYNDSDNLFFQILEIQKVDLITLQDISMEQDEFFKIKLENKPYSKIGYYNGNYEYLIDDNISDIGNNNIVYEYTGIDDMSSSKLYIKYKMYEENREVNYGIGELTIFFKKTIPDSQINNMDLICFNTNLYDNRDLTQKNYILDFTNIDFCYNFISLNGNSISGDNKELSTRLNGTYGSFIVDNKKLIYTQNSDLSNNIYKRDILKYKYEREYMFSSSEKDIIIQSISIPKVYNVSNMDLYDLNNKITCVVNYDICCNIVSISNEDLSTILFNITGNDLDFSLNYEYIDNINYDNSLNININRNTIQPYVGDFSFNYGIKLNLNDDDRWKDIITSTTDGVIDLSLLHVLDSSNIKDIIEFDYNSNLNNYSIRNKKITIPYNSNILNKEAMNISFIQSKSFTNLNYDIIKSTNSIEIDISNITVNNRNYSTDNLEYKLLDLISNVETLSSYKIDISFNYIYSDSNNRKQISIFNFESNVDNSINLIDIISNIPNDFENLYVIVKQNDDIKTEISNNILQLNSIERDISFEYNITTQPEIDTNVKLENNITFSMYYQNDFTVNDITLILYRDNPITSGNLTYNITNSYPGIDSDISFEIVNDETSILNNINILNRSEFTYTGTVPLVINYRGVYINPLSTLTNKTYSTNVGKISIINTINIPSIIDVSININLPLEQEVFQLEYLNKDNYDESDNISHIEILEYPTYGRILLDKDEYTDNIIYKYKLNNDVTQRFDRIKYRYHFKPDTTQTQTHSYSDKFLVIYFKYKPIATNNNSYTVIDKVPITIPLTYLDYDKNIEVNNYQFIITKLPNKGSVKRGNTPLEKDKNYNISDGLIIQYNAYIEDNSGNDTIEYKIHDVLNNEDSDSSTISINIKNILTVFDHDINIIDNEYITKKLIANNSYSTDNISFTTQLSTLTYGKVTITNNILLYEPNHNNVDVEIFSAYKDETTYTAKTPNGVISNIGKLTFNYLYSPVVYNKTIEMSIDAINTPFSIQLPYKDYDEAYKADLTFTIIDGPLYGILKVGNDEVNINNYYNIGTILSYTLTNGLKSNRIDTFKYKLKDSNGLESKNFGLLTLKISLTNLTNFKFTPITLSSNGKNVIIDLSQYNNYESDTCTDLTYNVLSDELFKLTNEKYLYKYNTSSPLIIDISYSASNNTITQRSNIRIINPDLIINNINISENVLTKISINKSLLLINLFDNVLYNGSKILTNINKQDIIYKILTDPSGTIKDIENNNGTVLYVPKDNITNDMFTYLVIYNDLVTDIVTVNIKLPDIDIELTANNIDLYKLNNESIIIDFTDYGNYSLTDKSLLEYSIVKQPDYGYILDINNDNTKKLYIPFPNNLDMTVSYIDTIDYNVNTIDNKTTSGLITIHNKLEYSSLKVKDLNFTVIDRNIIELSLDHNENSKEIVKYKLIIDYIDNGSNLGEFLKINNTKDDKYIYIAASNFSTEFTLKYYGISNYGNRSNVGTININFLSNIDLKNYETRYEYITILDNEIFEQDLSILHGNSYSYQINSQNKVYGTGIIISNNIFKYTPTPTTDPNTNIDKAENINEIVITVYEDSTVKYYIKYCISFIYSDNIEIENKTISINEICSFTLPVLLDSTTSSYNIIGITGSNNGILLEVGKTTPITVNALESPYNVTNNNFTFTSSNSGITKINYEHIVDDNKKYGQFRIHILAHSHLSNHDFLFFGYNTSGITHVHTSDNFHTGTIDYSHGDGP